LSTQFRSLNRQIFPIGTPLASTSFAFQKRFLRQSGFSGRGWNREEALGLGPVFGRGIRAGKKTAEILGIITVSGSFDFIYRWNENEAPALNPQNSEQYMGE